MKCSLGFLCPASVQADGEFTFYEDKNDNYNYQKGMYSTFTSNWNDKNHKLTISEIKGKFNGMSNNKTFNIVLVQKGYGIDTQTPATFNKRVLTSVKC